MCPLSCLMLGFGAGILLCVISVHNSCSHCFYLPDLHLPIPFFFFFINLFIYLFVFYFWLCWVFVAVCGLF